MTGSLEVLRHEQMRRIHSTAIEIIRDPGLRVESPEILDILRRKGVRVDEQRMTAHVPLEEIEETLRQLSGHSGASLTDDGLDAPARPHYIPKRVRIGQMGYMCGLMYDYDRREARRPTHEDMRGFIKLARTFGLRSAPTAVVSQDVPQQVAALHVTVTRLKYADPPGGGAEPSTIQEAEWMGELFYAAGLSKEPRPAGFYVSVRSPLTLPEEVCKKLLYQAERGIVTTVSGMPMVGATAPVTPAASIALHIAENLSAQTVSRLITRGDGRTTPRAIPYAPCGMDLRKGEFYIVGPDMLLLVMAMKEMNARFYKLPVPCGVSLYSDACEPGEQSMAETASRLFAMMLHGGYLDQPVEATVGVGSLAANIMASYEEAVMDAEAVSFVNRLLRGVEVDENALALEAIRRVGPSGNFVQDGHTLANLRSSWFPTLFHRGTWDSWVAEGRRSPVTLAHQKVREALAEPLRQTLSEDRWAKVVDALERAEKAILGRPTGIVP